MKTAATLKTRSRSVCLIACGLMASGCVGSIVKTVVTAPVKVIGKTVDLATTSQEEADRNEGRKARKQREREKQEHE